MPKSSDNSLVKATFWSSISSLIALVVQLARAKLAAVIIGPSGVAILTQLNSFLGFSSVLGGLGHVAPVVRDTSLAHSKNDTEGMGELHQTYLLALISSSLVAVFLSFMFAEQISKLLFNHVNHANFVRIVALAIPFMIGTQFFHSILKGFREVRGLAIAVAAGNIAGIILFIALIYTWNITGAVVAVASSQMAICLAAIWYASRGYARLQLLRGFKFKILKKNISYSSAGISLGVLSSFAGIYVVRTVIVAFGEDTAGIYSATSRFSSVYLGVIFGTTTSYFYPTVTQLNTDLEIGNEISKTLRLFQIVLTPTMIGLIIFYSPIIQILLSGRFIESGQLLAYQMPGDIFRLSFEIIVLTLLARGYPKAFVGCHVVWFIVYLGLVTGAAQLFNTVESICMAYSITYALVGLTASWLVPHFTGWQIAKSAYLTTTFSILFLLLASLTSLSSLSVIQKYAIGILLLVGWIGIHIRDPSAQKLINRLLSRSSRK